MPSTLDLSPTRPLTIVAQDPNFRIRGKVLTAQVDVPNEYLRAGPTGHRVQVIDYNSTTDQLIAPSSITDKDTFTERPSSSLIGDPHFHAQNVYAIAMATLAHFESALGRRVQWGFRGHQLKIAPHAFSEANAYYSREDEALMFGYFPGKRGPVFTCLSHDIVAHESAHALLDGLRRNYLYPSSPQQAAFHEGFADVVALLSVLKLPEVVDAALQPQKKYVRNGMVIKKEALTQAKLKETALLQLAEQMGEELSGIRGNALRASASLTRSKRHLQVRTESHDLGEVFSAAVLNAFLEVWIRRLFPNGTRGVQALDRTHVVDEGASAAQHLLTMLIRSLDYAPPVDLHFSDFLSAMLTADAEVNRDDSRYGYRDVLTDVFGDYGIEPAAKAWGSKDGRWKPPEEKVTYQGVSHDEMMHDEEAAFKFVWQNRDALRLEPNAYNYVESVRPTVRTNASGFVIRETVFEYVQILDLRADELSDHGLRKPDGMPDYQRIRLRGGGTLVFSDRGLLKLNVGSGVASKRQNARLEYLFETGHFDTDGAIRADLSHTHRIRAGGPKLTDPYVGRDRQ